MKPEPLRVYDLPRALKSLRAIHAFIAKRHPENAAGFISKLLNAVDELSILPQRHTVYLLRRKPGQNVCRMPVGMYLVYYRLIDAQRLVEVLDIRHGMRRQPERFA